MVAINSNPPSVKHHSRVISTKGIADTHKNIRTNLKNVFMVLVWLGLCFTPKTLINLTHKRVEHISKKLVFSTTWKVIKFFSLCCLTPINVGSEEHPQRVLAHTSVCFSIHNEG